MPRDTLMRDRPPPTTFAGYFRWPKDARESALPGGETARPARGPVLAGLTPPMQPQLSQAAQAGWHHSRAARRDALR